MPEATKKDIGKAFKTIVAILQAEDGVSLPLLHATSPLKCNAFQSVFSAIWVYLQHQMTACIDWFLGKFVDGTAGHGMDASLSSCLGMNLNFQMCCRLWQLLQGVPQCQTTCVDSAHSWISKGVMSMRAPKWQTMQCQERVPPGTYAPAQMLSTLFGCLLQGCWNAWLLLMQLRISN